MKPPPGWTPQHRKGAKRIRLSPPVLPPMRDPACVHGLIVCDAHPRFELGRAEVTWRQR